jgi:hypothetical protein
MMLTRTTRGRRFHTNGATPGSLAMDALHRYDGDTEPWQPFYRSVAKCHAYPS